MNAYKPIGSDVVGGSRLGNRRLSPTLYRISCKYYSPGYIFRLVLEKFLHARCASKGMRHVEDRLPEPGTDTDSLR